MITFSSPGKAHVEFGTKDLSLSVFPDGKGKGDLTLLAVPEEEVTETVISWPGEYDYSGVSIRGIGHDEGAKVSFAVESGGVRSAFLASPLHEWNDHDLELLGDVDILFIPADDGKLAQKMIDEVDPRILVPLPTSTPEIMQSILKHCGAEGNEAVSEYKLKGALPAEGREVVVLS